MVLGTELIYHFSDKKEVITNVRIYTAQYRYSGADRLDITVKGKDPVGQVFAPSWEIVNGFLKKRISQAEYTRRYIAMMAESVKHNHQIWLDILNRQEVTLVCFCPAYNFCHRYILAEILQSMGATYCGER
jgi:uncharacterized protein YeaO (DUF488 family)